MNKKSFYIILGIILFIFTTLGLAIFYDGADLLKTSLSRNFKQIFASPDATASLKTNNANNSIQMPIVKGYGSPAQISFFTGTSTIIGYSGLIWDDKNKKLQVGTPGLEIKIGVGDIAISTAADVWHHGYYFGSPENGTYVWGNQMLSVGPSFAYNQALFYGQGLGKNRGFQVVDASKENTPPYFFVTAGGNVGIYTYEPRYSLDVHKAVLPTNGGGFINAEGGLCINDDCRTEWPRLTDIPLPVTTKTSNDTLLTSDYFIKVDAGRQNVTLALPTAVGIRGHAYIFKRIDNNSIYNVIIDPNGSETIDGALNYNDLHSLWTTFSIISDGYNWLSY